jgi:hypothetical protein
MQFGELDVHINGSRELGVTRLQRPELGDVAWFDAAGTQADGAVGWHGRFWSGGCLFRNPVTLRHQAASKKG